MTKSWWSNVWFDQKKSHNKQNGLYSTTCYYVHYNSHVSWQYVNVYIKTDVFVNIVVFHNVRYPFTADPIACFPAHLCSFDFTIHYAALIMQRDCLFFQGIRGRDYINLFLSTKPLKNMADGKQKSRAWLKGFWSCLQKIPCSAGDGRRKKQRTWRY